MYGKSYKTIQVKTTIESAIDEAFSEFESLCEEMTEWRDNMEEKLSQTEKYQQVSDAADLLENVQRPDGLPDAMDDSEIEVSIGVKKYKSDGGLSRAARHGNACNHLETAIEAITTFIDEHADDEQEAEDAKAEAEEEGSEGAAEEDVSGMVTADQVQELEQYRDDLQSTLDEMQGVEFPGMY